MHISKNVGGQGCNDPQHRNAKITAIEALPQTARLDFNFLVNSLTILLAKGDTTNSSLSWPSTALLTFHCVVYGNQVLQILSGLWFLIEYFVHAAGQG